MQNHSVSKFNLGECDFLNTLHSASLCYSASHTRCHAANLFRRLPSPIKEKTPLSVLRMRVRFSFLYISQPFSSYQQREMTSFTVVRTTRALDQNIFNFSFLTWNRSWQFNPGRKVSKHFASQTTWRNYYRKSKFHRCLWRRQQAQTKEWKAEMLHEVFLH